MTTRPVQTLTQPTMAWAICLSTTTQASVTDAHIALLDEFDLAVRAGPQPRAQILQNRMGHIIHALVCAAGAVNSRSQMLRSVNLLGEALRDVDSISVRKAVRELTACHITEMERRTNILSPAKSDTSLTGIPDSLGPSFLRPLANIAVNRVSDKQLSATAADSLATLLGCSSLDPAADEHIPRYICDEAHQQTKRLIAMLITEIVLTFSPRALRSLSKLLRRDGARKAFCEKDGVSTLASTLQTHPGKGYTAIGEIVATTEHSPDPVNASYHAVFAVWMLTFAGDPDVAELVLTHASSSRLVVVLSRLLKHASGQRLKIARVTLASLKNMAIGDTPLHKRMRRDMVSADIPAVLDRFVSMTAGAGSLIGKDDDAMLDAHALLNLLIHERQTMSSIDAYLAEVKAGALHWSTVHKDIAFWINNAGLIIERHSSILRTLCDLLTNSNSSIDEKLIACNDIGLLIRHSATGRRAALSITGLKAALMELMVAAKEDELRHAALNCVQLLLLSRDGSM